MCLSAFTSIHSIHCTHAAATASIHPSAIKSPGQALYSGRPWFVSSSTYYILPGQGKITSSSSSIYLSYTAVLNSSLDLRSAGWIYGEIHIIWYTHRAESVLIIMPMPSTRASSRFAFRPPPHIEIILKPPQFLSIHRFSSFVVAMPPNYEIGRAIALIPSHSLSTNGHNRLSSHILSWMAFDCPGPVDDDSSRWYSK